MNKMQQFVLLAVSFLLFPLLKSCNFEDSCLQEGTLISTPYGDIPIDEIQPCDKIWSWNIASQTLVEREVLSISSHIVIMEDILTLSGSYFSLQGITKNHYVYNVTQNQFIKANELQFNTQLLLIHNKYSENNCTEKENITNKTTTTSLFELVYDIVVEGPEHNYFADGVLVHNKPPIEKPPECCYGDLTINEEYRTFADGNVECSVREQIEYDNCYSNIPENYFYTVNTLQLIFADKKDFTGIEHFINLHSLNISNIESIDKISNLSALEFLFLEGVYNLDGIEKLQNLKELTVSFLYKMNLENENFITPIMSFDKLSELTLLESLSFSYLSCNDFSFLKSLNNLSEICFIEGDFAAVDNIANLNQLRYVSIAFSNFYNMSIFIDLGDTIKRLLMNSNDISDIHSFAENFTCAQNTEINLLDNTLDSGDAPDIQLLRDKGCTVYWDGDDL